MGALSRYVQYTTSSGRPIAYGNVVATPISRVLSIKLPYWCFVWNRPVALRIEEGESIRTLPIVDVTLMVQIGLFSLSLASAFIALVARRAKKRRKN